MDKETLSNYGWVVICVLVLVVMIALATPHRNTIVRTIEIIIFITFFFIDFPPICNIIS